MFEETTTAEVEQSTTETVQPFADLQPEEQDQPIAGTTEQVEQTTGETAEAETSTEEAYQLPDEQLKVFPDEVYQQYADKRYPELAKLLLDPNLPEPTRKQVKQILHDKLNGDIRIDQLQNAGEEVVDEEPVEEQELEPTQELAPEEAAKAWDESLTTFVDRVTDTKVAQKFMTDLRAVAEIKDPVQRDIAEVKILSKGVTNLVPAIIDDYLLAKGPDGKSALDRYFDSRFPGFSEQHQDNARASAWEGLRTAPEFVNAKLPSYGTPEWIASVEKVAKMVPGFEKASFSKDPIENFKAKARVHAQLMAGTATTGTVAQAVKAVEKGKQLERQSNQRKQLGNLGSGQTKGVIAQNVNELPSDKARKESIARLREDENPFAALNTKQ